MGNTVMRRSLAVAGAVAALASYAVGSLLVAGPDNVLRDRFGSRASELLDPYGRQNWRLFAPSPISVERGVRAWARCDNGRVTAVYDLSAPRQAALQQQRFFPSREPRTLSGPLSLVFSDNPLGRVSYPPGDLDAGPLFEGYTAEQLGRYRRGERLIARVAARDLSAQCPSGVAAVRLRFVVVMFPRWEERTSPDARPDRSSFDSGWLTVP